MFEVQLFKLLYPRNWAVYFVETCTVCITEIVIDVVKVTYVSVKLFLI